jgi:hypothetical protein
MTTLHNRTRKALARTVAAALAGAIVTSTLGMPSASASPEGDLANLINAKHASAGCAPYGGAAALSDSALQIAQTMVANGGRQGSPGTFALTAENRLNAKGYFSNGLAEMDYFKNNGSGSAQDAFNFWAGVGNPFSDCGLSQSGLAVWINGKNFAAVSLFANPGAAPGPLPAADQPH